MAIRFDAVGDQLNRTANLPPNGSFTYMLWAVIDNELTAGTYQPYIWALDATSQQGYACGVVNGIFDIECYNAGAVASSSSVASRPTAGQAACIYVRCSGTGANLINAGYRLAGSNAFVSSGTATLGTLGTMTQLYMGGLFGAYWQDGRKWNIKVWDRALTDAEILAESYFERVLYPASLNFHLPLTGVNDTADRSGNGRNPTTAGTLTTGDTPVQLFRPSRRIFVPRAAGINVSLSVTDAADTLAATAGVAVGVALSATDAADTLSATAALPVSVSLSVTDAADTLSASAALPIAVGLSVTDASDTLSGTAGVLVVAGLSVTDDPDTLDATAVVGDAPIEVTLNVTDAADTLSATAALTVGVSLAVTDASDTLSATSTMPVTVSASTTDAADTLASTAGVVVGVALGVTDQADTLAATAIVQQEGVIAVTLDVVDAPDTLAATAVLGPAPQPSGSGGRNWLIDVPVDRREVVANITDEDDTLQATATVKWSSAKVRRLMAQHAKQLAPQGRTVQADIVDEDDTLLSVATVSWPRAQLVRSVPLTRAGMR